MSWYWIVLLAAAGAAAFVIVVGLVIALVASHIITKPKGINRLTVEWAREIQTGLGGVDFDAYDRMEKEPFTIRCDDGVELACEFIPALSPPPPGKPQKCLIRVHGFSQNRMISVRFIPVFRAMGYSVVLYDQRGFGDSTGFCSLGHFEKHDLAAIADWVRERLGEDTVIGLHGESLGAITILEALGIVPGIAFAIPDSCSTTVFSIFKAVTHLPAFPFLSGINLWARLHHGADLRDVRPIDRVANSDVPILFIHGTKDWPMPYTESEKLYAAAKNPLSRLELFEGVWHTGAHMMEPERYVNAVHDFVLAAEKEYFTKKEASRCSANTK